AFGVLSVLVLLSMRFFFIYEITQRVEPWSFFLAGLIPFFSKTVMGILLLKVPGAKKEGLGALFQNAATERTLMIYPVYVVVVFLAGIAFHQAWMGIILFALASSVILLVMKKKIMSWFGGMTGDLLGASTEGTELVLWITLWLFHYFAMV
ncbi:adenosylcobinamide-GDP ribazoletransferase, partial [Enterococcus faecium]|uniref:adenosylcobinamide-GDP ribazoletransferase n=1 Tax=Enterococcus faecium TaxID=1352 RepID=UPI0030C866B0